MMQRPRFSTTRLREGYEVTGVDSTVDHVMAALGSGQRSITAAEIERLRFTPVRLGTGYDMGEVDAWLDEVVAELQRRAGGTAPTHQPPADQPRAQTPAQTPAQSPPTTSTAAVQEVGADRTPATRIVLLVAMVLVLLVVLYVAVG